jgi:hypothetical protein
MVNLPRVVEAEIALAFEHWRAIGYSAQTSMALALAKHSTDDRFRAEARGYVFRHTNQTEADLV